MNGQMELEIFLALALVAFGSAWLGTRMVLRILRRKSIFDHPNPRSNHRIPTPRGGGLALVPVVLGLWLYVSIFAGSISDTWLVILAAVAIALVSWWDDLKNLSLTPRLIVQFLAAAACWAFAAPGGQVFQGLLPSWLDAAAAVVFWVWFINLFNFMDGIDGISGQEIAWIGAGLCVVIILGGAVTGLRDYVSPALAIVLAAASLGFFPWNWPPARIFLGDVGSVTLGFLAGWLLLSAAAEGYWAAAILLPLFYLGDATLTLGRRILRGERFWQAHKEHHYQVAVSRGASHAAVVRVISATNWVLFACAVLSLVGGVAVPAAITIGAIAVAIVLARFRGAEPITVKS